MTSIRALFVIWRAAGWAQRRRLAAALAAAAAMALFPVFLLAGYLIWLVMAPG